MEMVKKSGLALMLGAIMMSSMMVAADAAVAVGAPQVSHFQKLAKFIQWPVLDLNNISKPKIICAAALICLPFFLLHHGSLPNRVKNNSWFKKIIGTKEKDEKYELEELPGNPELLAGDNADKTADNSKAPKAYRLNKKPKEPCTGIFGTIESNFLKPWGDTLKSVTPLLAILAFVGVINQMGHH